MERKRAHDCFLQRQTGYFLSYDLQLFAKDGDGGEKTEEPTTKKLQDARNKGQVAKSTDATTAVSLLVFFMMLRLMLGTLGKSFMGNFSGMYNQISDLTNDEFTLQLACAYVGNALRQVLLTVAPFFATAFAVAFVTNLVQVKWKITLEPMKPKFDKFNPVSGLKRLFSKDKIVELLKNVAKIIAIFYVIYSYLKGKWNLVLDMYEYSLLQALTLIGDIIISIGLRISMLFIIIAVADFAYQKWKFHEDMKMTKQEVKDEYKNSEGDPKIKSQQRARMQQASRRRMMQDVPNADVVITNPTHLAVAVRYNKEVDNAPVVVAKGADYLAQRIKEIARGSNVEIVENKPLARMLYHNVDIGAEIPPELYQMVAEVLVYVYNLTGNDGREDTMK